MKTLQELQQALAKRWIEKHGPDGLNRAVGALKGSEKMIRAKRLKTLEWAKGMEAHIAAARRELGVEAKRAQALCDWLNGRFISSSQGGRFVPATLDIELYGVADRYSEDLVMECRTKMSARALSADFEQRGADGTSFEGEAVEKLVPVLALVYRLQALPVPSSSTLRDEARSKMIVVARDQRRSKYAPMLARDCYVSQDEIDVMAPAFREDAGFWKLVREMAASTR
ncbi:hypothetical protein [Sphingobium yanoikuyae]|uniref:Uncharacterized protein n=1 Tax=Sphingobium yanoikuyae TaxID=13690 RepID=A0A0J9D0L3_SPHYA|nr:hypothetical protein [Sphingobium yanoikuyae]ATP18546.1 hypothetical protein BV87_09185 [Sphingobium yanoikuyae]KMW30181.1 hypothetical protein BV87_07375 [Sphingobium yanoikuyae]